MEKNITIIKSNMTKCPKCVPSIKKPKLRRQTKYHDKDPISDIEDDIPDQEYGESAVHYVYRLKNYLKEKIGKPDEINYVCRLKNHLKKKIEKLEELEELEK